MNRVRNIAAQGDVLFRRVESLPDDVTQLETATVAHSETGHHHVAVGADLTVYSTPDPLVGFMVVEDECQVEHRRDFHTHETLSFERGVYEIRRQREYVPGGWRQVVD
jgi:hypothetical protein